jgi:hypothetical protein
MVPLPVAVLAPGMMKLVGWEVGLAAAGDVTPAAVVVAVAVAVVVVVAGIVFILYSFQDDEKRWKKGYLWDWWWEERGGWAIRGAG